MGAPGFEPGRGILARAPLPSSVHGGMRYRDERGSAAAHQQGLSNPGSWASGTSGVLYLARSVPGSGRCFWESHNILKLKGNYLICRVRHRRCRHLAVMNIRYNQIASYLMR
jgi:hypothetical protein